MTPEGESFRALCDECVEGTDGPVKLYGRPDSLEYALDCTEPESVLEKHVEGCRLWHATEDPQARRVLLVVWAHERGRQVARGCVETSRFPCRCQMITERQQQVLRSSARKNGVRIKNDRSWRAYVADDLYTSGLLKRFLSTDKAFCYRITPKGQAALDDATHVGSPRSSSTLVEEIGGNADEV